MLASNLPGLVVGSMESLLDSHRWLLLIMMPFIGFSLSNRFDGLIVLCAEPRRKRLDINVKIRIDI